MKIFMFLLIVILIQTVCSQQLDGGDDDELSIDLRILSLNSTSLDLEYMIKNSNDDLFDVITNINDFERIYLIKQFYYEINADEKANLTVDGRLEKAKFRDRFLISNLTSSTKYRINFMLEYLIRNDSNSTSGSILNCSKLIEFYTFDDCNCKLNSTINESCELNKCICKDCYEGDSCDKCKSGCYLNKLTQQCEKCPCDLIKSSGECVFNEENKSVKCNECRLPNVGLLCDDCDVYYYKSDKNVCLPCLCNYNTNHTSKRHCDHITGECIDCINNTTGKHCELCLDGYVGNALNKTCISLKDFKKISLVQTPGMYRVHIPMDYKNLFIFTLLIFIILFTIIFIIFYYNKFNINQFSPTTLLSPFNKLITNFKQRNQFNGLLTFERRGNNSNTNDDDNLNLAENQIFDECLFTDDFYYANLPNKDKVNNNNVLVTKTLTTTTRTPVSTSQNNSNPYLTLSA